MPVFVHYIVTRHHCNSLKVPTCLRHWLVAAITAWHSTVSAVRVYRSARHVAFGLRRARLWIVILSDSWEPVLWILRLCRRQEVDDEAPDVEDIDQCNDPLEDGADIIVADFLCHTEYNRKCDFGQDEEQFDPEGDT